MVHLLYLRSTLNAKFTLNMDRSKDHFVSEFTYFDGKVNRCKGFT